MTKSTGFLILALSVFHISLAADTGNSRVVPESGIYSDADQPGTGYVFETQGDTFGFFILSYGNDGEPEFLLASGKISEGFSGRLYRMTDGATLGSLSFDPTRLRATAIGSVALYTQLESPGASTYGTLFVDVTLDSPPSGSPAATTKALKRTNFGFGGFGLAVSETCWPDLRGPWVFIDKLNAGRAAWRYRFTEFAIDGEVSCAGTGNDRSITFIDPVARAQLRCVHNTAHPDALDGRQKFAGCELRVNGVPEVVFSFDAEDIMLTRMVGSEGGLTIVGSGLDRRRTGTILGLRAD